MTTDNLTIPHPHIEKRNFVTLESSNLLIEVFNKISHQDLHNIFILKKKYPLHEKMKHFKNIIDAIEYFDKQNKMDKINFSRFMEDLRKYEEEINDNTHNILRRYDKYFSINERKGINLTDDIFLKNVNRIIHNYKKED